jgi:lactoylglutathione lyase
MADEHTEHQYKTGPRGPRWTHIALPAHDIDKSIAWYEKHTPLRLLDRREDADGFGAWLGHPEATDNPFILVLVSFLKDQEKGPSPIMAPFAHIGIEVPEKADVDAAAAQADEEGCLHWPPTEMPAPIGYICAIKDPDGKVIEMSWDQGVYDKAKEVWG